MNRRLLLFLFVLAFLALSGAGAQEIPSYQEVARGYEALKPRPADQAILVDLSSFAAQGMEALLLEDGSLLTGPQGQVDFEIQVPETALYQIQLEYMPGPGSGSDIQRSLLINGALPFSQAEGLVFTRLWNDASRDYQQVQGNQPFPAQVQVAAFHQVLLRDPLGYVKQPFSFLLPAGQNTLSLQSIQEGLLIKSITLLPPRFLESYPQYLETALAQGFEKMDMSPIKIQGEDTALKSSPSFYPVNERSSPKSEPSHASYIVLNTIGGSAWNEPGEWLAWDVEVPREGLYRLGLRFKQASLRGMFAARSLRINGQTPFIEALDLRFHHAGGFQFKVLGDQGGEYWLHLKEGSNRIELEVVLGDLGEVLSDIDAITLSMNSLYREIIAITGTVPDINRNYQLFLRIPGLQDRLGVLKGELLDINTRLVALIGEGNERSAGFTRLLALMDSLILGEEQVVKHLSTFKESITSMGKSVLDLKDQPLLIDWLMILGTETPHINVNGNFFDRLAHAAQAFLGSFTNDYNVSGLQQDTQGQQEINVWISSGRDQFQVIRRLINEDFSPDSGIRVNLKLIGTEVLLPATFTGTGPEVALQIGNTAPVNFAFRGAAQDLQVFEDFEEVSQRFLPAAFESFRYEGGVYALPDQMSFPVMFYRKDILDGLGLSPPTTWTQLVELIPELQKGNMEIYLDTNPPQTLGAAVSMGNARPVNTVFLSRLLQTGGQIYEGGGQRSLLDSREGNLAFRWWTQFYTQHGFPRDIDFITRFRLGEVPLGIVDLTTYNTLAVSAPEIRNQWSIAPVPGTLLENGSISYATPTVTGASMIIKNIADQKGTREQAWDFLKWWTSQQTQTKYAREMEAVLGPSGRYLVANLDAFREAAWPPAIKQTLLDILPSLHGVPEVPGGYITGRYLNNAFLSVITAYQNPSDVLFESVALINEELAAKRAEFGLLAAPAPEGFTPQEGGSTP